MGFICLLANKEEIKKPLVTDVASGFFVLHMSGMHNGCVLVCKTSVVSSILTPDSWRCSRVGLCVGLKIQRNRFDSCRLHKFWKRSKDGLCNGLKIRGYWFDTNRFHIAIIICMFKFEVSRKACSQRTGLAAVAVFIARPAPNCSPVLFCS